MPNMRVTAGQAEFFRFQNCHGRRKLIERFGHGRPRARHFLNGANVRTAVLSPRPVPTLWSTEQHDADFLFSSDFLG
jgi:hypothetical protein